MRGEQAIICGSPPSDSGSPPLARGTAPQLAADCPPWGITPACAGNSSDSDSDCIGLEDHPRLRGEQTRPQGLQNRGTGSPPLARGTDRDTRTRTITGRITPACAGNSGRDLRAVGNYWDHPRLRGEQDTRLKAAKKNGGSPPLARGTDDKAVDAVAASRITPACAGNSHALDKLGYKAGDHPRLRGEQQHRRLRV